MDEHVGTARDLLHLGADARVAADDGGAAGRVGAVGDGRDDGLVVDAHGAHRDVAMAPYRRGGGGCVERLHIHAGQGVAAGVGGAHLQFGLPDIEHVLGVAGSLPVGHDDREGIIGAHPARYRDIGGGERHCRRAAGVEPQSETVMADGDAGPGAMRVRRRTAGASEGDFEGHARAGCMPAISSARSSGRRNDGGGGGPQE